MRKPVYLLDGMEYVYYCGKLPRGYRIAHRRSHYDQYVVAWWGLHWILRQYDRHRYTPWMVAYRLGFLKVTEFGLLTQGKWSFKFWTSSNPNYPWRDRRYDWVKKLTQVYHRQ